RGIGRASAGLFAREGARLGLIDRDAAEMEKTAHELAAPWPNAAIHWRAADIGDVAAITSAIEDLAGTLGGLDILVNNAAARAYGAVADATAESRRAILQSTPPG